MQNERARFVSQFYSERARRGKYSSSDPIYLTISNLFKMYKRGGGAGRGGGYQGVGPIGQSFDRYCSECGSNVKGQALEKPMACPISSCRNAMPLRRGYDENGWGRCANCDSFIHLDHCYCQVCRRPYPEQIEKRRRLKEVAKRKVELEQAQTVRNMMDEIERLKRECAEKDQIIEQHEDLHLARIPEVMEGEGDGGGDGGEGDGFPKYA